MLTATQRKELSNNVYVKVENLMSSLYSRWLDEKDYEDINDYALPIKAIIEPLATLTKMTKRPFGFEFTLPCAEDTPNGSTYHVFMKSTQYGYKRIK